VNTSEQAEAIVKVARVGGRPEHYSKHVKKPLAEFDSSQPYSQAEKWRRALIAASLEAPARDGNTFQQLTDLAYMPLPRWAIKPQLTTTSSRPILNRWHHDWESRAVHLANTTIKPQVKVS